LFTSSLDSANGLEGTGRREKSRTSTRRHGSLSQSARAVCPHLVLKPENYAYQGQGRPLINLITHFEKYMGAAKRPMFQGAAVSTLMSENSQKTLLL
jgi:hypothetical protein